jgi:hypothetical protein
MAIYKFNSTFVPTAPVIGGPQVPLTAEVKYFEVFDAEQLTMRGNDVYGLSSSRWSLGFAKNKQSKVVPVLYENFGSDVEVLGQDMYFYEGASTLTGATDATVYDKWRKIEETFDDAPDYVTWESSARKYIYTDRIIDKIIPTKTVKINADAALVDDNGDVAGVVSTDTVAAKSIRKKYYSARISKAGWYRIFESETTNASGQNSVIFTLGRQFASPSNEEYTFAVSIGFNGELQITQLSGVEGGHLITKIRVLRGLFDESHTKTRKYYIEFFTNTAKKSETENFANDYFVFGIGSGTFMAPERVEETPYGYTDYEITTGNGLRVNGTAVSLSDHTHGATLTSTTDSNTSKTLAYGEKYKLTAGGTDVYFQMPDNPVLPLDFTDPTASGTATSFIATVSQSDGKISATKKSVPSATQNNAGIVTLNNGTCSQHSDGQAAGMGHSHNYAGADYAGGPADQALSLKIKTTGGDEAYYTATWNPTFGILRFTQPS